MSDADDAGLLDLYQLRLEAENSSDNWYDCEENRYLLWDKQRALNLLDRIESQQREIKEIYEWKASCRQWRELAIRNDDRADKAHDALAEALKIIAPLAKLSHLGDPRYDYDTLSEDHIIMVRLGDLRAASAFAAKHGGRDE